MFFKWLKNKAKDETGGGGGGIVSVITDAIVGATIGFLVGGPVGAVIGAAVNVSAGFADYSVTDIMVDLLMPDIPEMGGSPTYASDRIGNTISEGIPCSRCYGKPKIGGNKIRFNDKDASDLRIIVAHCQGEINNITRYEVNDIEWSELTGSHTKTLYKGNRTQTPDGRFTDKASAYRGIAYTAFTFEKNDKQIGYDPTITAVTEGLLCVPLAGGADAFTRNPAVELYDWYLNVEGYSAGDLDLNAFKSLEELCDEVPTGSSLPRYRFDFNIDVNMAINDAKKLIWQSFNGRTIMSQGKIKPVWDSGQMADGSGSLTAKTVSHAFDMDNIVKDSLTWKQPERPNIVRIHFKDSSKNYKNSSVEIRDKHDIGINGEILHEEKCWFITDAEIARRRCQYKFNKFKYEDYEAKLTAFSGAGDLEVYDLVTVTHTLPGWTTKQFIVIGKGEDQYGRMQFTLRAYYSGCYDDTQVAVQTSYESDLPNPYIPVTVTSVALVESGFIAGDGSYVPYVTLTFTKPASPFWIRGQVWTSTDDSTFEYYGSSVSGDTFRIDAAKAKFEEGDTLYVKVLSENDKGAVQLLADVSSVSEVIDGKSILPSDITGFSASQIGDIVLFLSNRPAQGTDADFSHFELRQGPIWDSSQLISTFTHTKYLLTDYTAGSKTYMIKAVDTSGNKSATEVSKTITLVPPSIQNIYYEKEKINRIGVGSVSNVAREYNFNSLDGGFFVDGTEKMNDSGTDKMNDSETERMWTPGYDSGYLEAEVIDAGASVTGAIYLDLILTNYAGVSYFIQYKTSTNEADYTAYATFVNGVSGTFRYIIFKITLLMDKTNYPQNNILITGLYISVDLPTIKNSGVNVTVAPGGTAITFNTAYITAASISINVKVVSATALIATYEIPTKTGSVLHCFDPTDGSDDGGIVSWESDGF